MKVLRPARTLALLAVPALNACAPDVEVGFDSPDPQGRTIALARAADSTTIDDENLRQMIVMLGSIDPAQRMLAINALKRAAGQTLGYRHFGPEEEREAAQQRWVEWYSARGQGAAIGEPTP
jgi:hypothetical protein